MTRPLTEPTYGRDIVQQGYDIRQLQRRPAPPAGCCPVSIEQLDFAVEGDYVPANLDAWLFVELVGSGGGGGGTGSSATGLSAAGGGGAGGYSRVLIPPPLEASYIYTVGAGGAGGANTGTQGSAGVTSLFTDAGFVVFCEAFLGNGGLGSNVAGKFGKGGDRGCGTSAVSPPTFWGFNVCSASGMDGNNGVGGCGGSSPLGGGGRGGMHSSVAADGITQDAEPGNLYGGGGGGAAGPSRAGLEGGGGLILVTTFA